MIKYPDINPIAFSLGPIDIYWYGVSYLMAFLIGLWLLNLRRKDYTANQISDLVFYVAVGVIFGGRVGYVLFYQPELLLDNVWTILAFWERGRSFHGGLLGVLVAFFIYGKVHKKTFFQISDFIAPVVPIGIAFGRIGNFLNAELWGRVTDVPWGMVFPMAGTLPRHPSQLYECLLEGILLFIFLWLYSAKPRAKGMISAMFLIGYGLMRFVAEFFREPDVGVGVFQSDLMTMGQVLSVPMVLIGIMLWAYAKKQSKGVA